MSLNDFEFGKELGKGAFGSVTIVKRKEDQKIYAMKRVKIGRLSQKEKLNSFNEVRILASIEHKNIIGYKEAFFDDKSKTLNIVMEYADGGDLSTKIKELKQKKVFFDEDKIWSTLIQILEGLNYLHKSCIIHRDLKSANIFLTKDGGVKIGDLNVSKILNKMIITYTQTGTPYFASPEIWNDMPYDYKCDIWSVGCIIYEMASLHVPFRGVSMQNLYKNVLRGIYQQIPSRYSDELKQIIKTILVVNPKNRPSSEDLLENPIIKKKKEELGFGLIEGKNGKNGKEKAKLMKTIKIPVNMSQINRELPQKKYEKNEMLLNDEYETAKRTFYRPQNYNSNDNDINNNKSDKNEKLDKDLIDIQKITNSITNDKNDIDNDNDNKSKSNNNNLNNLKLNNNIIIEPYLNSIKSTQKKLKNLDNNIITADSSKKEENSINNINNNNKFSNINYAQVFNDYETNNRIVKTENNQNNDDLFRKDSKKNKNILKLDLIDDSFNKLFLNNDKKNEKEKNDFKEKYTKLMEDINKNKLNKEQKEKDKEKEIKLKNQISEMKKDVLKSKKEVEELDKNLNLLNQNNKDKKQLKYKTNENLLEQNLFRNKNIKNNNNYNYNYQSKDKNRIKRNISDINNIENNINKNFNLNMNLLNQKNKIRKINNKIIDMNLNEINNNKKPLYINHKSSRPNINNYNYNYNYSRYLPTIIGSSNNRNINKEQNDKFKLNKLNNINNNNYDRYNIFSNYNSNINNNKNNYYFNNCNFINNNLNNNDYINKYNINNNNYVANPYNNNYLRNPYNNNYNLYNNYNQIYKEYFNNFMKYLSSRDQKHDNNENKIEINEYNNINNNININNENKKRKIIYEKINILKDGNEYKYQKGPSKIEYVGGGNYYNQFHKAIIRNNLGYNNNKNYGIQNLFYNGTKLKNGPRIILPNKMFG